MSLAGSLYSSVTSRSLSFIRRGNFCMSTRKPTQIIETTSFFKNAATERHKSWEEGGKIQTQTKKNQPKIFLSCPYLLVFKGL